MTGFLFSVGIMIGLFGMGLLMIQYFVEKEANKLSEDKWWNKEE